LHPPREAAPDTCLQGRVSLFEPFDNGGEIRPAGPTEQQPSFGVPLPLKRPQAEEWSAAAQRAAPTRSHGALPSLARLLKRANGVLNRRAANSIAARPC